MRQSLFIASFLLLLFSACGTKKNLPKGTGTTISDSDMLLSKLVRQQLKADWLYAKATMDLEDSDRKIGVSATIKWRKDSVLWMNVKKFGIEGARVLVTTDSVFVLDRLSKTYLAKDLNYLAEEYQIPADFNSISAMILGNPVFLFTEGLKIGVNADSYELFGQRQGRETRYQIGRHDFRLKRAILKEAAKGQELDYRLSDYRPVNVGQGNFAYFRSWRIKSPQSGTANVEMKFTKVELDQPQSIRFEIPDHYTPSGGF